MEQILFGKYTVTGLLGVGANSQVYLVRHQILRQNRAVKQIPKSLPGSSGFLLEAELLKSLNHPGIPIIYDIEEDDTYYYIIEEYVQGESLEAFLLHQKTISLNFFLQIGRQLCEIIGYLHTQPRPVIYQDLKPEHIIVYGDQIKIVDYGTASFYQNEGNPYEHYGSERYAAPEKQQGGHCDERTDIYGIGRMLSLMAAYLPQQKQAYRLCRVIDRALAQEPAQRFATTDLLKKELEQLLEQEAEIESKKESGKKLKKESKKQWQQTDHDRTLRENKHLQSNLAVIGMQPGIGATHLSISWNVYLNASGQDSVYVQQERSGVLQRMLHGGRVRRDGKSGEFRYGDFRGVLAQEADCGCPVGDGLCCIRDFGTYESMDIELEMCDAILLVLGGRDWEHDRAEQTCQQLGLHRQLALVVNYGNERAARRYAKKWRRNVYCFPPDTEPFALSVEKRRFFEQLYKKEGW